MHLAIGCVSPPIPPSTLNLVRQFKEGTIVEFGETVSYVCAKGYHFHRSFTQKIYNLKCLHDGTFLKFDPLEYCVDPKGNFKKMINHSSNITFHN